MSQPYGEARNGHRGVRERPNPPLLLLGHTHIVRSVAFLPDGKEVISGSDNGNIRRWRIEDGCKLVKSMWDKGGVLAVAASRDGRWIATGGERKNITLWNATTYEKAVELEGHSNDVRSLEFSPNSARVVSGSTDKTVIVWSTTTTTLGKCLLGPLKGHAKRVREAHFSPNGHKIASCDGRDIRVWDSHSRDLDPLPLIKVKAAFCATLAWTPDGQQLIAALRDSIKCFSSSTGALLAEWKAHPDIITSIAVSPNGKFMTSASHDRTVRLWDMTTFTRIGPTLQCGDEVYSVAISPAGSHVVSGGHDMRVRIWSLESIVPPSLLKNAMTTNVMARLNSSSSTSINPAQAAMSSAEVHSPEGHYPSSSVLLASDRNASPGSSRVGASRELPQYNPWDPKPPLKLRGQTNPIWSIAFLPDGKEVISGSWDGNIRRWRVEDGCELGKEIRENGVVYAVAASSDGLFIATGGKAKNIAIWDATTYEKVIELEGHSAGNFTRSLEFSPDSARLVSGSTDKTVIVWSTGTGQQLSAPLKGHTNSVWEAHFSPNGDKIASCDGCDIRIWDSHSGDLVIQPITVKALSLAWTPDGQQLIAGCTEGSIKRFYSPTGFLLADWQAHASLVHSISVSPNGKFLASASPDKTVRLWAMTTSTQIGPPLQCPDRVYSVAISPDGTHLARGGRDSQARIWRLEGMVSQSLLNGMPSTSDVGAHSHGLPSKGSFVDLVEQDIWSSLEEDPWPPKTITNDQGKDPGHLNLRTIDRDASLDSDVVRISGAREELPQPTPWNLDDIHSSFPNDLTGSVMREGEHPFASGSYGDIYKGTLRVRGRSTVVAVKAIKTYTTNDDNDTMKKKKLNREIRVWLNLKHINILPLFGTTMDFGQFPAMVCPWLEDGPLTSYLERRNDSLTTVERLVLVADVAVGLQYRKNLDVFTTAMKLLMRCITGSTFSDRRARRSFRLKRPHSAQWESVHL
ncbi:WD40 repeat-like protein [Paxillus ammoniavirescens]|nr:WD40 repeat-like protein [Paxillus ammoniavirescens]